MRIFLAAAAAPACWAASVTIAAAQDVLVASDGTSGAKVYARRVGNALQFRTVAPVRMYMSYDIDANDNGTVEREVDVSFSTIRPNGVCAQNWLTAGSWSFCGKFRSAATATQETVGDTRIETLTVPIAELSRNTRTFGYRVTFWDNNAKARRYASGRYTLASGSVANAVIPAPSPAPSASTSAAAVSSAVNPAAYPVPVYCKVSWRTVRDEVAGATYEMGRDPKRSYFISYGDNMPSSSNEEELFLDHDDCGDFHVAVWSLGNRTVTDTQGFFSAYQKRLVTGLKGAQTHSNRAITVGGYPARDIVYSFLSDWDGSRVYNRTIVVARDSRVILLGAKWQGSEAVPPKVKRSFASFRLTTDPMTVPIATFALLEEAITKYWMFPAASYKYTDYFAPTLLTRLDARRKADSVTIKAFGYPRSFSVISQSGSAKVVRVKHDDATVDWTVTDNGSAITDIKWTRR